MDEFIQIEKKMTQQTNVTWYPRGDLEKQSTLEENWIKSEIGTNNLENKIFLMLSIILNLVVLTKMLKISVKENNNCQ